LGVQEQINRRTNTIIGGWKLLGFKGDIRIGVIDLF
jgi:hypothetical protein